MRACAHKCVWVCSIGMLWMCICVCETVYGVCMRVIMGDGSLRVVECVPEKELKFV